MWRKDCLSPSSFRFELSLLIIIFIQSRDKNEYMEYKLLERYQTFYELFHRRSQSYLTRRSDGNRCR